jgi:glutamine synthetase
MSYNLKTPEDVLRAIKDDAIQMIELWFTDLPGLWHHFSVPANTFDLENFARGVGFEESSIGGSLEAHGNNMLAIPDPTSAFLDPFARIPTLVLICNVFDPLTGRNSTHDPRYIAQKAEIYLQTMQIGDAANFGLELEDFVFSGWGDDQSTNHEIDTAEATRSMARRVGPGHGRDPKGDHFPVPPTGRLQDVQTQVVTILEKIGINVEAHFHELATDSLDKIDLGFATLTRAADNVMVYKYVLKNVACQHGIAATLMPNPLFGYNGSGVHVHQSIWQGERPLFAGDGYAGSSALMRHYLAGLLEHAPLVRAICAEAVNTYRRPMTGSESKPNSPAGLRVTMYSRDPKAKRVEFRLTEHSWNPYLAFASMLMAGIDGFHNRLYSLPPGEPIEKLYDLPPQELAAPSSLNESLNAPEISFLLQGDVFTRDVIETHLSE